MREGIAKKLYAGRRLADGFPNLESLGVETFVEGQSQHSNAPTVVASIVREIGLPKGEQTIAIVGSGPFPVSIKMLCSLGHDAKGVEPIIGHVEHAQAWLADETRIRQGTAEDLPFDDQSQTIVLIESVLEHVDSPIKALEEAYRVLVPGGVVYVQTTNRLRFSATGNNGEYRIPFLNWMPDLVKEAFVHQHLHFDPTLANFSPRPAVHWFSYPDLCKIGRDAGFHRFYSKLDILAGDDPALARGKFRAKFLNLCRYNPWFRSVALSQVGDTIYMLKRPD